MTTPYFFAALPVSPDVRQGSGVWQPHDTRYDDVMAPGRNATDSVKRAAARGGSGGDWYIRPAAFADVDRPLETVPAQFPDGSQDRQLGWSVR
jgi:hypothetical protein